jgi:formylglycine-generating enzyme required for sulfatase activity
LLREAVKDDDTYFGKLDEDADLDPIRGNPAFAAIMEAGHPDRRYAAVWTNDANFEATTINGFDPGAHLRRCRELIVQGYRPASLSVARTMPRGPLVTASVWHRPVVQEEVKDRLAERQARAAVALVRMGKAEQVWPLLRYGSDPRLRGCIINWLHPLGTHPEVVAAELERSLSNTGPMPSRGRQSMEAILFHPETSMRRALILALGSYGTEGLSSGEREPLVVKLLGLYRNDPDAGIHGAAEWALRKWGQEQKIKTVDAELLKVKDGGVRRWYVNGVGQTFAIIEGPVAFRMGSPPNEPERDPDEPPHRRVLLRRFAIAAKEVTVEQFQRFVGGSPQFGVDQIYLRKYSPEPNSPMVGVSWYGAAAYCNWLSDRDGLPRTQWCYLPGEGGSYAEGMTIPADALRRAGYRLPTEAEWEYACRGGTITSRYHGLSTELLGSYAWYQANSRQRAWPCGMLLPNDLGLFDMLGNVYEWCQDPYREYQPGDKVNISDLSYMSEHVTEKTPRPLRGGTYYDRPANVRSANRSWNQPSFPNYNFGFRLARTLD